MALIGLVQDGIRHIGELDGDTVYPIAPVDEFYAQPTLKRSPDAAGIPRSEIVEAPFVPETARVFCVGINYHSHADEAKDGAGLDVPKFPMVFGRWQQSLVTHGVPVPVPPHEEGLDWEVELAVVIKDEVWLADPDTAFDHVLGYSAFNDLSARKKQLETAQFTLGKNADRSGPIGPALLLSEEISDVTDLNVTTRVNGDVMQSANTRDLIHKIEDIIAYITDTVTLLPGDVIATGTPGGVGLGMNPRRYLTPGDTVEVEIDTIGVLRNPIVSRDEL